MARRTEITLDRAAILTAALVLLGEQGLDGLTMRAVADRLSVKPPALYWHFRNKAELLGWMVMSMLSDARNTANACGQWRDWLATFARCFAGTMLKYRDGALLIANAQPALAADNENDRRLIVEPLTLRGLSDVEAHTAMASVMAFTLGWATYLSNAAMSEFLAKLMDVDSAFEVGLDALISGLPIDGATNRC